MYLWQHVCWYNHIIFTALDLCCFCNVNVRWKLLQLYTLLCAHTRTKRSIPARAETFGLPNGRTVWGALMCCFDCLCPPVPRNSMKNTISLQHLLWGLHNCERRPHTNEQLEWSKHRRDRNSPSLCVYECVLHVSVYMSRVVKEATTVSCDLIRLKKHITQRNYFGPFCCLMIRSKYLNYWPNKVVLVLVLSLVYAGCHFFSSTNSITREQKLLGWDHEKTIDMIKIPQCGWLEMGCKQQSPSQTRRLIWPLYYDSWLQCYANTTTTTTSTSTSRVKVWFSLG